MARFLVGLAALVYTLTQLGLVGWVVVLMVVAFLATTIVLYWPWGLLALVAVGSIMTMRRVRSNVRRRKSAADWEAWRRGEEPR